MFPKEFEFKRVYENCEYHLEMQLLGWSRRGLEPIRSPWNLDGLIRRFIEDDLKLVGDFKCEKPEIADLNLVANDRVGPFYGSLYVKVRNMWALHFAGEVEK